MSSALDPVRDAEAVIYRDCRALWRTLSPLGRRAQQPANFLPLQTVEARGKPFNATIGQITDGQGRAVPLPPMAAALGGLEDAERSRALLYSPVDGLPELRRAWQRWQQRGRGPDRFPTLPATLPIVTAGTAHARALAAQLFVGEGRTVLLPRPCQPRVRELFTQRLGARVLYYDCQRGMRFDSEAVCNMVEELPEGEPVVVLIQFPPSKAGYRPTETQCMVFGVRLSTVAWRRPMVAIVDDTWERWQTPSDSLFWGLTGPLSDLVPLKVDGADGRFGFPGGRVGFLTFPFAPDSAVAQAVESKVKMLLRAEVGSPPAATQMILLRALEREGFA